MQQLKIIIFLIGIFLCIISNVYGEYETNTYKYSNYSDIYRGCNLLENKKSRITFNDFSASAQTVDKQGCIYVVGWHGNVQFIRKYDIKRRLIWTKPWNITTHIIDIWDIRAVDNYIYLAYVIYFSSNIDPQEGEMQIWYAVLTQESGRIITIQQLGETRNRYDNEYNPTFVNDMSITRNGEIAIILDDNSGTWIEKYDQGFLAFFHHSGEEEYFKVFRCDSERNNYIAGIRIKSGIKQLFIRKYTYSNSYVGEQFVATNENDTVEDMLIANDKSIYCLIIPNFFICHVNQSGTIKSCTREFAVCKFDSELQELYIADMYIDYSPQNFVYSGKLGLTNTEVYVICNASTGKILGEAIARTYIVAIDSETGKQLYVYKLTQENLVVLSVKMYKISEKFFKRMITTQQRMRVLTWDTTCISFDFWVPQVRKMKIEYSAGWQFISLPLIPIRDITFKEFKSYTNAIVAFTYVNRYQRVEKTDKLKPGIGYMVLFPHETQFKYIGREILSIKISPTGYWNVVGGCTYPFFYHFDDSELYPEKPLAIFEFELNGYSQVEDSQSLIPGKAYWIKIGDDISLPTITAEVYQEELGEMQ